MRTVVKSLFQEEPSGAADAAKTVKDYNEALELTMTIGKESAQVFLTQQKNINSFSKAVAASKTGLAGYKTAMQASTAATAGMAAASAALEAALSFGVTLAIQGLVSLIQYFANRSDTLIEKGSQAAENIRNLNGEFAEQAQTVNNIKEEYAALAQGVDPLTNRNLTLNTEEYQRFLELQQQLAGLFPELTAGYDENGNAILNLGGNVDSIIGSLDQLLERQQLLNNMETVKNLPELFSGVKEQINEIEQEKTQLQNEREVENGSYESRKQFLYSLGYHLFDENGNAREGSNFIHDHNLAKEFFEKMGVPYSGRTGFWGNEIGFTFQIPVDMQAEVKAKGWEAFADQILEEETRISEGLQNRTEAQKNALDEKIRALKSQLSAPMQALVSSNLPDMAEPLLGIANQMAAVVAEEDTWDSSEELQDAVQENVIAPLLSLEPEVNEAFQQMMNMRGLAESGDIGLNEYQDAVERAFGALEKGIDPATADNMMQALKSAGYEGETLEAVLDGVAQKWSQINVPASLTNSAIFQQAQQAVSQLDSAYGALSSAVSEYNQNGSLSIGTLQSLLALDPQYLAMLNTEGNTLSLNQDAMLQLANAKLDEMEVSLMRTAINTVQSFTDEATAAEFLKNRTYELADANKDLLESELKIAVANNLAKGGDVEKATNLIMEQFDASKSLIEKTRQGLGRYFTTTNNAAKGTNQLTSALNRQKEALESQKQALQDQREELQKQRDAMQKTQQQMQDDQSAINSLLDLTMNMLRKKYETEQEYEQEAIDKLEEKYDAIKKTYDAENEAIQESISLKKEALEQQRDEREYQKELEERRANILELETQLNTLRLDNSASAQKHALELEEELADAKQELDDFLYDHETQAQLEALEKQSEETDNYYEKLAEKANLELEHEKEIHNAKLEQLAEYLEGDVNLRNEAIALINARTDAFYQSLLDYNRKYGSGVDAEVKQKWNECYDALGRYNSGQLNTLSTLNKLVESAGLFKAKIAGLDGQISNVDKQIGNVQNHLSDLNNQIKNVSSSLGTIHSTTVSELKAKQKFKKKRPGNLTRTVAERIMDPLQQ